MKKLDNGFYKVAKLLDFISQILLFCLMCFFVIYIVLRLVGITIYGTVEIAQYGCLFIVVFGLARNEYKAGNIEITVLRDALPPVGKQIINIFSQLFSLATCAACEIGMIKFTANKIASGALSSVLDIPVWTMAVLIAIGFAILLLCSLVRLVQICCGYTNKAVVEDEESSDAAGC